MKETSPETKDQLKERLNRRFSEVMREIDFARANLMGPTSEYSPKIMKTLPQLHVEKKEILEELEQLKK